MSKTILAKASAIIAITVLAFFLRAYRVDQVPPSLSSDEASIGWNAYSILKTGFDEHQRFLPIASNNTLVLYLTIPSILAFGLNDFAVRFPSVLFGTLTVMMVYFLTLQMLRLPERKNEEAGASRYLSMDGFRSAAPILASLLLAISPSHIQLSRIGLAENISLFWMVLGAYLLLSARTNPRGYAAAWLPFVGAIYCLRDAAAPALILGRLIVCFNLSSFRHNLGIFLSGILLAGIMLVPIPLSQNIPQSQGESIFSIDPTLIQKSDTRILVDDYSLAGRILHSPAFSAVRVYLTHLMDYFEPDFLISPGDQNPKYSLQDVGQLYLIDTLFLVIGVYTLFRWRPKLAIFSLLSIVGLILPAAAIREVNHAPSALRFLFTLPFWQVFIAAGILYCVFRFQGVRKILVLGAVTLIYAYSLGYFINNYFLHYPIEFSAQWQFGNQEAIQYAQANLPAYEKIEITDSLGEPYLFALFYGKYDPAVFWATVKRSTDAKGVEQVQGFGKYEFVSQYTPFAGKRVLFILPANQAPNNAHILRTIKRLDGSTALVIFE